MLFQLLQMESLFAKQACVILHSCMSSPSTTKISLYLYSQSTANILSKYLLFIDTEASGLPKNWTAPFNNGDNWPYILQVSWWVFDEQHQLITQQDHYINADGISISPSAMETHSLTPQFLAEHGKPVQQALQLLAADMMQYNPMVIGHFMQLDYYLLGAAYHRLGIPNPLNNAPLFCTMIATKNLRRTALNRQLRLDELYFMLFNIPLAHPHNALYDAQATAESFFELSRLGEISDKSIAIQNKAFEKQRDPTTSQKRGCFIPVLFFVILVIVTMIYSL